MRRICVDHELLVVSGLGALREGPAPRAPDAPDALRHLVDAGHELVVVGPSPVDLGDDGPTVRWQSHLGGGRSSGWYLTSPVAGDPRDGPRRSGEPGIVA